MSVKSEAKAIIDQLDESAGWMDVIKALYLNRKITLGMSKEELNQASLSNADVNAIIARLKSASDQHDDMRNTKKYEPGNAATMGMVAGVIAILFAFVFPPITWVASAVAIIAGILGLKNREEKSWIPILLGLIPVLSMYIIF